MKPSDDQDDDEDDLLWGDQDVTLRGWCEPQQLHDKLDELTVDWSRPVILVNKEAEARREKPQRHVEKKKSVKHPVVRPQRRPRQVIKQAPLRPVELEAPEAPRRASSPLLQTLHAKSSPLRLCTLPPSVMLEIDKQQLSTAAKLGPRINDADMYAQQIHYSNYIVQTRIKKGLSYQASSSDAPLHGSIEQDKVHKALLRHKSKPRRLVELQQLERALLARETRKVDIERQLRFNPMFESSLPPPPPPCESTPSTKFDALVKGRAQPRRSVSTPSLHAPPRLAVALQRIQDNLTPP
ncbi:hypothetical protein LEN26_003565 [Aphanomyces euteiches]|nr:hypothetical protein AeMF1_000933 [Aphanomyces euteiches]KAH9153353.1 hypothetical protein LEN26_003565 [Aphanomyces euteiches]KAH9195390.1 hypothetical protein AeNC1_002634 [Aphanomyces euteiches]